MLPETFVVDTCFPNDPSFATRDRVSAIMNRNIFWKLLPVRQNWETLEKHVSAADVLGNMFPRFAGGFTAKFPTKINL